MIKSINRCNRIKKIQKRGFRPSRKTKYWCIPQLLNPLTLQAAWTQEFKSSCNNKYNHQTLTPGNQHPSPVVTSWQTTVARTHRWQTFLTTESSVQKTLVSRTRGPRRDRKSRNYNLKMPYLLRICTKRSKFAIQQSLSILKNMIFPVRVWSHKVATPILWEEPSNQAGLQLGHTQKRAKF